MSHGSTGRNTRRLPEERVVRAHQETGVQLDAEDAEVERVSSGFCRWRESREGKRKREKSRVVGIKSSPSIGLPDRRGRELINCRNERGMGDREACGSDRKTGNRQRMLKLVNRTNNKSRSGRFTFCADLRDVASRIPSACPTDFSLSLSLLPPFIFSKENRPFQTPWLRQWRTRIVFVVYRFLRLPTTRRRVHPTLILFLCVLDASSLMLRFRLRPTRSTLHASITFPVYNCMIFRSYVLVITLTIWIGVFPIFYPNDKYSGTSDKS